MNSDTGAGTEAPSKGSALKPRIDYLFLSLVLFVATINLPVWLNVVIPVHDTMNFFQNFYFFYNELYFNGELAQWAPYGYYGIQSDFFFICQVPPAYYLSGLLGYVLRIEDAYFLFKATLFFEQVVFLYGVYKLAGYTFKRKATAAFVCLASVGGTALLTQSTFNFRAYFLLPLLIYLMVRFFATYKPQYILVAMLVGIVSLIGGGPYIAVIVLLQMTVVCPVLFIGNLKALKTIRKPSARDIVLSALALVLLVSLAASYQYYVRHTMDETVILSGGRDPMTGATDLRTFLRYGGDITWEKFTGFWSPEFRLKQSNMGVTAFDETIYFGAIPFAFFVVGLAFARRFRNPIYTGALLLSVVLALLSVGYHTAFATWLYNWFPLMKYYRHVGYVTASFKFLIPLLAGFGFEYFTMRSESVGAKTRVLLELAVIAVFVLSAAFIANTFKQALPEPALHKAVNFYIFAALAVILIMGVLRLTFNFRSHILILVVVLYIVEAVSYQALIDTKFIQYAQRMKPLNEESLLINDYDFMPQRTMQLITPRARAAAPLVVGTTPYAFGYNFLQWEPCMPQIRADLLNDGVTALLTTWKDPLNYMSLQLPNRPLLLSAVGCNTTKLRLLSEPAVAAGINEAMVLIRSGAFGNQAVVLSNVPDDVRAKWESVPHSPNAAGSTIKVNDFRANGLDLTVEAKGGPLWVYYADAWHSGWHATVNDKPQGISRANVGFKAVLVPEGKSTVSFFFNREASYRAALVIIFIGTLVMAALLASVICALLYGGAMASGKNSLSE